MKKTRPELTMELNDMLWDHGWASFRTDRSSSKQAFGCDVVALKGGKVRFITIERLKGGTSKTGVVSKIDNLKEIKQTAEPLSPTAGVDFGWALAIYISSFERWFGVNEEVTTVKGSEGHEPILQVL